MSRSFFTLLRLCTGRRLLWAALACALLMLYELVQLMLSSYGTAGQVEIMGIDLPPLVLAAEALGRSAAPWLFVPFMVCSYAQEHMANGYAAVIRSNGGDAKSLASKFMLVATVLALGAAAAMCAYTLLVCALFCRGTFDASYMMGLSSAGVRVLTDDMALNYAGAIVVGMLRVVAIGAVSMGITLIVRWRYAGALVVPMVWLALSYTPATALIAGVLGMAGMPLGALTVPVCSVMAYMETTATFHTFLCSEALSCLTVIAVAALVAIMAPRSLRVKAAGSLGKRLGGMRRDHA